MIDISRHPMIDAASLTAHDGGMVFGLLKKSSAPPAREKRQITLGKRAYGLIINRRHNARRMTIRVRDEGINLTTPYGTKDKEIHAFLFENQGWIDAQITAQANALAAVLPGEEGDGPMIYYQGEPTPVILIRSPNHRGASRVEAPNRRGDAPDWIEAQTQTLTIRMNSESRIRPIKLLEDHLRREALTMIRLHLKRILPLLGEDPVPVSIRDQKTRWGSCSTTRRLSFNWRLVMAPPASLEYVVVHEAVHLIHHDHSPRFWGKVAEIMPDYRRHQCWLRSHQTLLFADLDRYLGDLRPRGQE